MRSELHRSLLAQAEGSRVLPVCARFEQEIGDLEPEEREVLQQRDILLSDAAFDPLDNELQNIYACLAQPSEHLTVSYPVTDHNGGQLRPSFVVRRLERLFPGLMPERETVHLLTPAVALEEAGQEMGRSLWRYFAGREEYAGTLAAMERARQLRRGRLSPAAVQSLYGTRMGMSASRMDIFRSRRLVRMLLTVSTWSLS